MYLLIDNYDSFTYNLFQYISEITDKEIKVARNDEISIQEIESLSPEAIIISPGPGRPEDAGISLETIKTFAGRIPILGVCLGHQCIAQAFGARIIQAKAIMHGKTDMINHDGRGVFRMLPSPLESMRYHSLAVDAATLPENFEISATSPDGEIMGIRHKEYVLEGVQFHPESIGQKEGKRILSNFLTYKREPFDIRSFISARLDKKDASREEAEAFMDELTSGNLSPAQIAGALVAINAKGFASQEVAGCAAVLRKKAVRINPDKKVLDTCGTGGDGLGTFNISSFSALIAASCGASVAKHGNRAVSSKSGSADFYAAMGLPVELPPSEAEKMLNKEGFAFLFAPLYHKAMRYAAAPRKELGIKTIMNFLGPLSNPAFASYQLIGVFSKNYLRLMAEAAIQLGVEKIMTVHAEDGQDEISVCGKTHYILADKDGNIEEGSITPEDMGLARYNVSELIFGDVSDNVTIAERLLDGEGPDAVKAAVCANAGAALYVAGFAASIKSGVMMAMDALSTGRTKAYVNRIRSYAKN
ncbi:bifunctional anthranilate synthase component II/anthranilate phosphoribosyltransferase [Spirochaetia bacterium 38H-sp]|uniref:Anthranilate phosphoribosyltransferase n=1 Tax=Rarispira pelagica TaxID=3141764 RepID=A0ABU9U9L4_9SPIR